MFDSHVHTSFSCDSEMPVELGIKKAAELELGIVITDHMDINPFRSRDFTFDADAFFETYGSLRNEKVLLGIEMGMRIEAIQENMSIVNSHNFDFVLGSTHAPYDMETPYEYYDPEFYKDMTKEEAYNEYLSSMLKGLKGNPYIDSLAHIDYIARYSPFEDKELYYDVFAEGIDSVLVELVRQNKSMEISTRRLGDEKAYNELKKIYTRFAELGGETVTIGSDSHTESAIGTYFDKAIEIARFSGLRPVYYKNREKVYINI